jgi:hypothetical protein
MPKLQKNNTRDSNVVPDGPKIIDATRKRPKLQKNNIDA